VLVTLVLSGIILFRGEQLPEAQEDIMNKSCPYEYDPTKRIYFTLENEPKGPVRTMVSTDLVVVSFRHGTSETKIREIISHVHGCVVDIIPQINAHEVKIPEVGSEGEMQKVINLLRSYPEVEIAEPMPHLQ
jgi:hypothetical protein